MTKVTKPLGESYTATQQRQVLYLRTMERRESMSTPYTFNVTCHDCEDYGTRYSCEGTRCFIQLHRGHRTWIEYQGRINPLNERR